MGFTHLVWIPTAIWHTGTPCRPVPGSAPISRVPRQGEAVGIAAGLMLGGARPLVAIQCTGFFEAGDAVRNVVHDLKLPLKLIVGVRSWSAPCGRQDCGQLPALRDQARDRVGVAAHALRPDRRDRGPTRGRKGLVANPGPAVLVGGVIAVMTHREMLEVLAANRGDHVVITTMGSVLAVAATVGLAARFPLHPIEHGPGRAAQPRRRSRGSRSRCWSATAACS